MVKITPISSFKTLWRCLYASFLGRFLGTILSSSWRVMLISMPLSKGCPFEKASSSLLISSVRGLCFTFPTGAHSLFSLASGMGALTSSFFGSVHILGNAENMEFNNICIISFFVYRGTRLSHPHFRYFRDKSNGASQPHFFNFSIGKSAISLMDKAPRSPQQHFFTFQYMDKGTRPNGPPFFLFHTDRGSMVREVRSYPNTIFVNQINSINFALEKHFKQ